MPRSATTGVFTRVSNSFSNPVFGTLIDPTDAISYFDDLDVGLNPPELDGPVRIIDKLQVGTTGTADGTVDFLNATSGSITLSPPAGALGTVTLTLPAATDTLVGKATTDTLTNKTLTSPVLTTPNLGTPSALVLTNATGTPTSIGLANGTGLPISTGVSGLAANVATFLATPSSANLRAAITDESGTGAALFQGGDLGTPSAGIGTNITALNATQLTTGTIPAARTNGHMNGTATNDAAAAGEVGEYVESAIAVSTVALVNNTAKDVTSISLTAGDWDVDVSAYFTLTASTNITILQASISGTTNTIDTTVGKWTQITFPGTVPGAGQTTLNIPPYRLSLSGTTTVFFVVQGNFTVSTLTAGGLIRARRCR